MTGEPRTGLCFAANGDVIAEGNAADLQVNDKLDLVNLFPVAVDVSPFRRAWGSSATFRLRCGSDGLRYCRLSGVTPARASSIQTTDVRTNAEEPLESAALSQLDFTGVGIGDWVDANGHVMLAFMASGPVEPRYGPKLEVSIGEETVYRCGLPLKIASVDDMYRYLNLRGAETNQQFTASIPGEPTNLPDAETDNRNFVFVHGYNVNAEASRDWARAIFKRLWWAGSRSKFTAVDWRGDESQKYVPTQGDSSPNYYVNVKHAFMTAGALTTAMATLPGRKVMLAHSLGNMLVSAAIKDHNLAYDKYYMLNAAVPMEAYDENAYDDLMVDGAWEDLDESFRAAHFSELFAERQADFRNGLSWKGRFVGIHNAVNCYSPTEDVLANPTSTKIFGLTVSGFGRAWSKQELFKGCALWYGVNAATFSGTEIEGGWGINAAYTANPLAYIPLVGFNASYFDNHSRNDKITSPLFTSFNDNRMHTTNALCIVDEELRAKMLGDAIPAESFAAGANVISGVEGNYNMGNLMAERWPANRDGWFHSDLKNVAFWYTYKLFEKIKRNE